MKKYATSKWRGISFIAFVFSLFIMLRGMPHYSPVLLFLFSFPLLLSAGFLIHTMFSHLSPGMRRFLSGERLSEKIYASFPDKKLKLLLWALIFLFFFPSYIALFPGTFGYDAPIQAAQYFGEMELTAANPLLHTYLLGTFLSLGEIFMKNAALGLSAFCLMQGLLAAQVLAKSLLCLKNIRAPFTVITAGLLWILFNPSLHVLTFNATKDILFGVCFLHFLCDLLILIFDLNKSGRTSVKKEYARLILSGVLMCLLRNAAIYLTVALVFAMLPAVRRFRETILSLCTVFAVSCLFSLFVSCGLKIPAGDTRENLSLPIQQLSAVNYAFCHGTEPVCVTTEQLDTSKELFPAEAFAAFQPDTADPVKSVFRMEIFLREPQKYISLYLRLGLQNPHIYARAFRDLTIPYLDMSKSIRRHLSLEETFPGISHVQIPRFGFLPSYYTFLERQIETEHYFLLQPGLSIYLMVIGIGLSINRRNLNLFLCNLPAAIYFIGLLLGPVALLRYLYPLMLSTPLLLGIAAAPSMPICQHLSQP